MTGDVVGRERQIEPVYAFFDRPVEGLVGLVLEGDAGIGKSTPWFSAVAAAQERGFVVLSAQLAEAERGLAYVGLGDLLADDLLDEVLPALAAPRRRVLEVTLLQEVAAGDPVDPRALGVATRDVLQSLAGDRGLLIAIDDVQWLDDASARALAFAQRRLDDEKVVLLERLVRGRLGDLSPATRGALALVAAGGRLSQAALGIAGVAEDALAPAFDARVIEHSDGFVRLTHPLPGRAISRLPRASPMLTSLRRSTRP